MTTATRLYNFLALTWLFTISESCPGNFTRVGHECYHFNSLTGREFDWKVASKTCKKMGGFLAEMETIEENQDLVTFILSKQQLKGNHFVY